MFPKSLRGIFLTTSTLIALSLCGLIAVLLYESHQVSVNNEQLLSAHEAEREILRSKFYTVQIQQFFTDASLTGDKEAASEARENFLLLTQSLDKLTQLNPELAKEFAQTRKLAEDLSAAGEEMFSAYREQGKAAGDIVMKRKDTGLDDLSKTLADQMDKNILEITRFAESRDSDLQLSLTQMRNWPIFLSLAVAMLTLATLHMLLGRINALKTVSHALIENTGAVSSVVADVFAISQNLSATSSNQAAAVQETAASIEEISAMAKKSAESAGESERASHHSQSTAERGQKIVTEMVEAVENIQACNDRIEKTVTDSNASFKEIFAVIEEIGTKTRVINDIVFQTKLLSFNASVEAARAGEHGKGFAVVAEEVGNLAQMSGNAAQEISHLLAESVKKVDYIVQNTTSVVGATMVDAKTAVVRGVGVAKECARTLNDIVTVSEQLLQNVSSISLASQEQSSGVAEVSKALHQIDQSTQVGLNSSNQCASAADQLAAKLKDLQFASGMLTQAIEGRRILHQFSWSKELCTGVDLMDDEHGELVKRMNHLVQVLSEDSSAENEDQVRAAYSDLASYAIQHFADEEKFMESISYPDLESHKAIHQDLLAKVTAFGDLIGTPKFDGFELTSFLKSWLMKHILAVDKKYGPNQVGAKHTKTEHDSFRSAA